ncbi:MAG: asparagine synthase (glutamine-hydrolyzing) [Candidatus Firestonebacteria bacterium]
MCGIYGFINLNNERINEDIGLRMGKVLTHRGPDVSGCKVIHSKIISVFLGSNRLKVIDLSDSANQPLGNEDGKIWVTFNGEIYNFKELRKELIEKGHKFKSNSDTEVIVHLYEEFDYDFIKKLDGMFAFALWDGLNERLICGRDRTGKKPFYYYVNNKYFSFASEIKSLLVCPWIEKLISIKSLPEYFTYGYVRSPDTMYEEIYELPPASYIIVNKNEVTQPIKYWNIKFSNVSHISVDDAASKVREILINSVSKRLISDVPIGVLLSGGLDSSIITGIITKILKKDISTITSGFSDSSFDERHYAHTVAKYYNTKHTEFVVKIDAISLLDKILFHYDQPCGDPSAIPTYLVCDMARKYVTVALNGDGGDEVFAGYDRFKAALLAERLPNWLFVVGKHLSKLIPHTFNYYSLRRRAEKFFGEGLTPLEKHHHWITIFNEDLLKEIFKPEILKDNFDTDFEKKIFNTVSDLPLLHQLLYHNFITYLPDNLNVKMDRMSMANSLETRSPMLDTALIEFVATLPQEFKICKGQTKYILRKAFKDILPPQILNRKKHGFGIPLAIWFTKDLGKFFEEKVLSESSKCKMYLNQEKVRQIYNEHLKKINDNSQKLWLILQFELWLQKL